MALELSATISTTASPTGGPSDGAAITTCLRSPIRPAPDPDVDRRQRRNYNCGRRRPRSGRACRQRGLFELVAWRVVTFAALEDLEVLEPKSVNEATAHIDGDHVDKNRRGKPGLAWRSRVPTQRARTARILRLTDHPEPDELLDVAAARGDRDLDHVLAEREACQPELDCRTALFRCHRHGHLRHRSSVPIQ